MAVGSTLRTYCDKHASKISEVYRGSGYYAGPNGSDVAYDILLEPGWCTREPGLHTIIEATVADTIQELREITPCNCEHCP